MSAGNRIVSILDDESDITELFHDALQASMDDISIVSFNDPVIALEHFAENKGDYALVTSDLRMPNLNGLELLRKVKKLNPSVRTILASAHKVEHDLVFQKYFKEGIIDSLIQKPVDIKRPCQRVRDELEVYQLAQLAAHTK